MNKKVNVQQMVVAALLCAIGIMIPMMMPIKVVIPPASFTLASHVAIFIAMFISLPVGVFVALGTTLGFFLGGFPLPIVLRALSQVVFVALGAWYLQKHPQLLAQKAKVVLFALVISLVHGLGEVIAVLPLYLNNGLTQAYYDKGMLVGLFGLVGFGTVIHSMVDFGIALVVWGAVEKLNPIKKKSQAKATA